MVLENNSQETYFQQFENNNSESCTIAKECLNDIKSLDEKLYKIGCSLDKAYKNIDSSSSQMQKDHTTCGHLNN
ncbi:hypothetical protein POVCU2_0069770 [Plasmodium ovale curtisi]|uniref:PIR Superfamily Protein n=1 Tax=Plasmodium ovale curtisi TaxID=864141 RepID=A0A1A8WFM8_PLAOA|nr:hypothetical protein POVCU2_0069770 [Plasmodium ovale curtisi]